METKSDARCVATIANRDPEQMEQLKAVFARCGASIVELPADDSLRAAHLAKRRIDLVLLKLTTDRANRRIFGELQQADFRYLNSLRSVKLCQSRRATFAFANRHLPDVRTPRMFVTPSEASRAIADGRPVWVRRDAHNIPLEERVLGVAHTTGELDELIGDLEPRTLFFQEYLGRTNDTYKAYVVGSSVVMLRRTELQDRLSQTPDAVVERTTLRKDVEDAILSIGRAFGMSVYGVDLFYRGDQAVFLDFNDFPSFRGIPEASQRIWEFVATTHFRGGG